MYSVTPPPSTQIYTSFVAGVHCQYLRPPFCLQIQLTADSGSEVGARRKCECVATVVQHVFFVVCVEESALENKHSGFHLEKWVQQCKHSSQGVHAEHAHKKGGGYIPYTLYTQTEKRTSTANICAFIHTLKPCGIY